MRYTRERKYLPGDCENFGRKTRKSERGVLKMGTQVSDDEVLRPKDHKRTADVCGREYNYRLRLLNRVCLGRKAAMPVI